MLFVGLSSFRLAHFRARSGQSQAGLVWRQMCRRDRVLQYLLDMPQLLLAFAVLAQYKTATRAEASPANISIQNVRVCDCVLHCKRLSTADQVVQSSPGQGNKTDWACIWHCAKGSFQDATFFPWTSKYAIAPTAYLLSFTWSFCPFIKKLGLGLPAMPLQDQAS